MKRLKAAFPHLPICICVDSLYASKPFFQQCEQCNWKYLLTFQDGSIPSVTAEYETLKQQELNRQEIIKDSVRLWYDYVPQIDYEGHMLTVMERGTVADNKACRFLTNLPVTGKNVINTVERGRWRWKIENEGFNTQKKHGYALKHMFSHNNQATKSHYYLIQLLSDTNWAYDFSAYRSMDTPVGTGTSKSGTETPPHFGIVEN